MAGQHVVPHAQKKKKKTSPEAGWTGRPEEDLPKGIPYVCPHLREFLRKEAHRAANVSLCNVTRDTEKGCTTALLFPGRPCLKRTSATTIMDKR